MAYIFCGEYSPLTIELSVLKIYQVIIMTFLKYSSLFITLKMKSFI